MTTHASSRRDNLQRPMVYNVNITPGMLVLPGGSIKAYPTNDLDECTFERLDRADAPMLVLANVAADHEDVTYRPTLVLTARGAVAWVIDFHLLPAEYYGP